MALELQRPDLFFPTEFCCNCGDMDCVSELQETRVTRFFGIGGSDTTFHLSVPICAACRKTTRRRPAGLFVRLLVCALLVCAWLLALLALGTRVTLPGWITLHLFAVGVTLGVVSAWLFYRMRRPRPPQTSFYQPVRIKDARVQFDGLTSGSGQVVFMKLAFTNPDYLNVFRHANRDAIDAGHVAVVRA